VHEFPILYLPSAASRAGSFSCNKPVIPNKSNRIALHRFNKCAYKGRNVIERCFCRLKVFRRIATRYDKLARNFLAAIQLSAVVAYWIN
jgi:transposase